VNGGLYLRGRDVEESASFWKKKQKLLLIGVRVGYNAHHKFKKFFGSFFQKRTAFIRR
jgi:hypothetical protein